MNEAQDSATSGKEPAPGEPSEPPRPTIHPDEQRAYWRKDLHFRAIQLYISLIGFGLVMVGLVVNYLQVRNANAMTRVNVNNAVLTQLAGIDRLFIERPHLMPYFYGNKTIEKTDEKYPEVRAAAGLILDLFDFFSDQSKYFGSYWEKPDMMDDWMIKVFSTSPVLCEIIDDLHPYYSDGLKEKRILSRSMPKSSPAKRVGDSG